MGVEFLRGFSDGHPQLPVRHRRHQVPVLDSVLQYRIFGAASLKIGADTQDDQARRGLPGGGCSDGLYGGEEGFRSSSSWHWVNNCSN